MSDTTTMPAQTRPTAARGLLPAPTTSVEAGTVGTRPGKCVESAPGRRLRRYTIFREPLTGLANRSHFLKLLAAHLTDARRADRMSVCVLTVPQVNHVSRILGPEAGDDLLRRVGRHLGRLGTRHDYLVGSLGGDKFAVAIPYVGGTTGLTETVCRILDGLPRMSIGGHDFPNTAKAGVVDAFATGARAADLLQMARAALDWAREEPSSRYVSFDPERNAEDNRRQSIVASMPAALRTGQFQLHYQPLFRLHDGRVIGVEALARWHHPTLGQLSPADFIPLAEQTGLIEQLGMHLLERACHETASWSRIADDLILSVNVSPAQLGAPGLASAIAGLLDRTGFPPQRLQLELTETGCLDTHRNIIATLADLGVRLAIDDFGTGYSALAYLNELPINTVKLDARLLHHATPGPTGHRGTAVLSRTIAMCHDLGITVIAEGIETATQAQHLTRLGCDIGQGYHLAPPAAPHTLQLALWRGSCASLR